MIQLLIDLVEFAGFCCAVMLLGLLYAVNAVVEYLIYYGVFFSLAFMAMKWCGILDWPWYLILLPAWTPSIWGFVFNIVFRPALRDRK